MDDAEVRRSVWDLVAESDELREGIILDYDKEEHIASLETLDVSEYIAEPVSIAYELKGVSR